MSRRINTNKCSGGGHFRLTHPRLYKWLISNLRAFFIGGLITLVVITSASSILHSRQVRYKNDKSVETAINELYEKVDELGLVKGCKGCTKLEYLESTGTQYIDTEYIPKINTRVELEIKFSGAFRYGEGNCGVIFGVKENENNNVFQLNFGGTSTQYNNLYAWTDKIYGKGGKIKEFYITDDIRKNRNLIVMRSELVAYENISLEVATKTNNNSINFVLFGVNNDSDIIPFNSYYMYVYTLKIYEEDTLKRDYIPVLDKNERPCLFDKVSKTCFYNQGTGEFLYG